MDKKVKLPKEVAEAIDHCRNTQISNRVILRLALDERGSTVLRDTLYKFAESNFDTLVSAVYGQYEVEQTPEDKVREIFENSGPFHGGIGETGKAYRDGIRDTLDTLNIKIEGVNA